MSKHKWAKEIHAWADGAVIQKHWRDDPRWIDCKNPRFDDKNCEYRASLATVEGRLVFEGDVLYDNDGSRCTIRQYDAEGFILGCSWNPPKPKTITVELLREDAEYMANSVYCIEQHLRIQKAIKEAMK
jgi:hypothetical protein